MEPIIYYDILRHRFTTLIRKDDSNGCSLQGLSQVMNLIGNHLISDFEETQKLQSQTEMNLELLLEGKYQPTIELKDTDEKDVKTGKIIAEKCGYLMPDNETKWALLIDHRSWSQLKHEENISESDIHFLKTGHRLIRNKIAKKFTRLERFPFLEKYPQNPVEWIVAQFSHEYSELNKEMYSGEQGWESTWFNCAKSEPGKIDIFANDFRRNWQQNHWWEEKPNSGLRVTLDNNETMEFCLERLCKTESNDYDEENSIQHYCIHQNMMKDGLAIERKIRIFNEMDPIPTSKEFFRFLRNRSKPIALYSDLWDTLRAFIASTGKIELVSNGSYLAPFCFRHTLLSKNENEACHQIRLIDEALASWLEKEVRNQLWLN